MLLAGEMRLRNRAADIAIESAAEMLDDPAIRQYAPDFIGHRDVLDNYVVPNVRHGDIVAPPHFEKSDKILLVPIIGSETLKLTNEAQQRSPGQLERIATLLVSSGASKVALKPFIEHLAVQLGPHFLVENIRDTAAHMFCDRTPYPLDQLRRVVSQIDEGTYVARRPATFIRASRFPRIYGSNIRDEYGLDLIHETRHVRQALERPLMAITKTPVKTIRMHRTNEELEAREDDVVIVDTLDLHSSFRSDRSKEHLISLIKDSYAITQAKRSYVGGRPLSAENIDEFLDHLDALNLKHLVIFD